MGMKINFIIFLPFNVRSPGRNGLPKGLLSLGVVGKLLVGCPGAPVVMLPPTTDDAGPSTLMGDVVAAERFAASGGLVGVSGVDKFVVWPTGVVVVVLLMVLFVGIALSKPGDEGVDGGFSLCGDSGNWLWLESSSIDEILPCA